MKGAPIALEGTCAFVLGTLERKRLNSDEIPFTIMYKKIYHLPKVSKKHKGNNTISGALQGARIPT